MHSDIYEQICFKLGVMVNNTELHISVLVYVILTLNQVHKDTKS